MAEPAPKTYSNDPILYLYTSLTSGSSHIVTATSRMETILKANRIPFLAIDIATDEKARMLWGRRSGKDESGRARKIPGLVQMGLVVGDLVEIEDWNEYGELKQHVTIVPIAGQSVAPKAPVVKAAAKAPLKENIKPEPEKKAESSEKSKGVEESKPSVAAGATPIALALRQVGQEAAQKAKDIKKKIPETFSGVGQASPTKEKEQEKADIVEEESEKKAESPEEKQDKAAAPPSIELPTEKHEIASVESVQSPTSTAWRGAKDEKVTTPQKPMAKLESIQSPTSTAWKPTDINTPILTHRGSTVSEASAEEIKKVEDEQTIPEEDEDEDEDEEEESSEEDEDEDEDEDAVKDKK